MVNKTTCEIIVEYAEKIKLFAYQVRWVTELNLAGAPRMMANFFAATRILPRVKIDYVSICLDYSMEQSFIKFNFSVLMF